MANIALKQVAGLDWNEWPTLHWNGGRYSLEYAANTLGARNDLEAVDLWLSRYAEKPSTQRSYRKEAERLPVVVACRVHGVAVVSAVTQACALSRSNPERP